MGCLLTSFDRPDDVNPRRICVVTAASRRILKTGFQNGNKVELALATKIFSMNTTTHNGKIARLPQTIREQLNQRLADGEPGGRILEWLNALPSVQSVLGAEFGGGINAQNLSNWRKGGYQDWLKQQERRANVRQLTEDAKELDADAGGVELSHHFSAVLVAELLASARDELATITDPAERRARMQEILHTLVSVRRQDNLAGRLAIERERRAQERASEENWADMMKERAPAMRSIRRAGLGELYESRHISTQMLAGQQAESLLRGVKLDGSKPDASAAPDQAQSN